MNDGSFLVWGHALVGVFYVSFVVHCMPPILSGDAFAGIVSGERLRAYQLTRFCIVKSALGGAIRHFTRLCLYSPLTMVPVPCGRAMHRDGRGRGCIHVDLLG